jgi:hypothetical protein
MKQPVLSIFAVLACTHEVPSLDGDLSAGTGGTDGASSRPPVAHPDFGFEAVLEPERLDLPQQDLCGAFDILFVIDNSGSMGEDQERLVANVPSFIEHLVELGIGAHGGIHVGVVSTDSYGRNEAKCRLLGALVTQTAVDYESVSHVCGPYADGARYMTKNDDLEETFSCAAMVGTYGSGSERPIDAMLEALDYWHGRPGGCNEGYHRLGDTNGDFTQKRSSLLVVFITDEDDIDSIRSPWEWMEHVERIRDGTLEDAAFIGLFPDSPCTSEYPTNLLEFMNHVPYSLVGSICDDNYGQFFAEAIPFVAAGCGISVEPVG